MTDHRPNNQPMSHDHAPRSPSDTNEESHFPKPAERAPYRGAVLPPLPIVRGLRLENLATQSSARRPKTVIPDDLNQPLSFVKAMRLGARATRDITAWQFLTSLSKRELCELLYEVSPTSNFQLVYARLQRLGRV